MRKRKGYTKKDEDIRVKHFLLETLKNILKRLNEEKPLEKAHKKRIKSFKKDIKINFKAIEEDSDVIKV